ncbi:CRISPR-associated endonuclease Cas1 [Saccharopolyspora sp. NPDC000995]
MCKNCLVRAHSRRFVIASAASHRGCGDHAARLAESECRLACLAVGLDPANGIHHADKPDRDSQALDLLEIL